MSRKSQVLMIALACLMTLAAVVALIVVFTGGNRRRAQEETLAAKYYQEHYSAAEKAFLRGDYDAAYRETEAAMEYDETEDCYLLLADIFTAQGDTDGAIRVLMRGESTVGGSNISGKLSRLRSGGEGGTVGANGDITVGGRTYPADTVSVILTGKNLINSDLETICRLTELESLSVSDNDISDLSPLTVLRKLDSLQIANNRIRDISALSTLCNLKTLYLDGNPISDFSPLYSLSNLRTLSLKEVQIDAASLQRLKSALPDCSIFSDVDANTVRQISIGGKTFSSDAKELNLGGLGLKDISGISEFRNVEKLDLRDNQISDISPLVELANLEWLCLWNNRVTDLMPLMTLTNLRYLDVDSNSISSISVLERLTNLEELWLNNNTIRSFTPLKSLTKLTRLGLNNTGIDDASLSLLQGMTNLKELVLEENSNLTAAGVADLEAALPNCTITHDDLSFTVSFGGKTFDSEVKEINLSRSGITNLAGLDQLRRLEKLDLSENDISDLTPLYSLSRLRELNLTGNPKLTEEAVDLLQVRLPDCKISFQAAPRASAAPRRIGRRERRRQRPRQEWVRSTACCSRSRIPRPPASVPVCCPPLPAWRSPLFTTALSPRRSRSSATPCGR